MLIAAEAADKLRNTASDRARLVYSELQNEEISLISPMVSYKSVASGSELYRLGSQTICLGPKQGFLAPANEEISVRIDQIIERKDSD